MATGGPPDTLTARHRMIAMLLASGRSQVEIAQAVGMSANRISIIASSPMFQALVREFQGELLQRLADVTERLHAEALPTLEKLVHLRDGGAKEEVQLGAANSLADRIPALAKKVKHEEERTLRILYGHDVEAVLEAIAEEKGEVYRRPIAETASVRPLRIEAIPLDDAMAMAAAEAAE